LETDEDRTAYLIRLPVHPLAAAAEGEAAPVTDQVTDQVTPELARLLAAAAQGELTRSALQGLLELKHPPHFRQAYLRPAMVAGLLEMTLPGQPNSRLQRYRLTALGQRWLRAHNGDARP
jgi:ATP-dependent DNA helicase RecG